jgi:hypothetical protein
MSTEQALELVYRQGLPTRPIRPECADHGRRAVGVPATGAQPGLPAVSESFEAGAAAIAIPIMQAGRKTAAGVIIAAGSVG